MNNGWFKSARSNSQGACVEVNLDDPNNIYVRNSRTPEGPALCFTPDEWDAFLDGARNGEFDTLHSSLHTKTSVPNTLPPVYS